VRHEQQTRSLHARLTALSRVAIGDALLARFKKAVALHVAALPAGDAAALAAALDALALLSSHPEATPLLESLLAWRLNALREATTGSAESARRRVLAVETAFWEAVSRLLQPEGALEAPSLRLAPPLHVCEALEALAFEALLASPPPDSGACERLGRAVGSLSLLPARLLPLSQRFFDALDVRQRMDSAPAREQAREEQRLLRSPRLTPLCAGGRALQGAAPAAPAALQRAAVRGGRRVPAALHACALGARQAQG